VGQHRHATGRWRRQHGRIVEHGTGLDRACAGRPAAHGSPRKQHLDALALSAFYAQRMRGGGAGAGGVPDVGRDVCTGGTRWELWRVVADELGNGNVHCDRRQVDDGFYRDLSDRAAVHGGTLLGHLPQ